MSVIIEKAGILDTLQDAGRFGFGHLGVNANGPMDWQSHQLANALVGNNLAETVIESHFPAPMLLITQSCVLAFSGADFGAQLHGKYLPINKTLFIPAGSTIRFTKKLAGERLYIAVRGGFEVAKILGSTATNIKAAFGGLQGRPLRKGDVLRFNKSVEEKIETLQIKPWFAHPEYSKGHFIRVLEGPEWKLLTNDSKEALYKAQFTIVPQSDRMAIHLAGEVLYISEPMEMISSAVQMGTVQLLPNGQLLTLMADHQTVGGYPRVLQIIKADLPKLAQLPASFIIKFQIVMIAEAGKNLMQMQKNLLRSATAIRMQVSNM